MTVQDIIHDLSKILYDITSKSYHLDMKDEVALIKGDFFYFTRDKNGNFIFKIPTPKDK